MTAAATAWRVFAGVTSCMLASPGVRRTPERPSIALVRRPVPRLAAANTGLQLARWGRYISPVRRGFENMSRTRRPLVGLAALTFAVALSASAATQERRVPGSPTEMMASFSPVVHRVAPMVVNVYAAKVVANRNPFADDPFFRRFFDLPGQMPREQVQRSLGSGVIVDSSGLVVTNNHVIEGADEVKVALADKREFEADAARAGAALARFRRDRRLFRIGGDQQSRHRRCRRGEGSARRQARVRGDLGPQ